MSEIDDMIDLKSKIEPGAQVLTAQEELAMWLAVVLDAVDYTQGMCRTNEMVGAVLERSSIACARKALDRHYAERDANKEKP